MSGNNVTFRWLVVILLVILFVSAAAAAVEVFWRVNISATEYTDAGDYGRWLGIAGRDGSLWYFPDEIPDGAEDVKFIFRMPFIRGREFLELSFRTSSEKLGEYNAHFANTAARRTATDHVTEYMIREPAETVKHGRTDKIVIDEEHGRITFRYEDGTKKTMPEGMIFLI